MRLILGLSRRVAAMVALALSMVILTVEDPAARSQAAQIATIAPASGRAGDRVTIAGSGFGALNVRVTVGGIPAELLSATGYQVTFVVPRGLAGGRTTVVATNPGGRVGSIGFQVLGGVLLTGDPNSQAGDAIIDLPPVAAPQTDIEAGIIMTRLDVRLAPDATVGEVNAALTRVGAEIASMSRGFLAMTIAIPRQPNVAALRVFAATLDGAPGISAVLLAIPSDEDELPAAHTTTMDHQLMPTRFPAAWNARSLAVDPATGGCRQPRVPVLVGDQFEDPAPIVHDFDVSFVTFAHEIPNFVLSPAAVTHSSTHGSTVTLMLGARFNPEARTGANPFSQCLDITAVQLGGLSSIQAVDHLVQNFPTGKFILNYSRSFGKACVDSSGTVPCQPEHFGTVIQNAFQRAEATLHWKLRTALRWSDFLVTSSAGNVLNKPPAAIYPALGTAALNSFVNAASLPDPMLGFVNNAALWQPTVAGFENLAATIEQAQNLENEIFRLGLGPPLGGADNVLKVGSTTKGATYADLTESAFSNLGPDVSAVGEKVLRADETLTQGTSFSAPQVAGLTSYLWLLSPQLRAERASVTRRAILQNTRSTTQAGNVIDAYATVLSLDPAGSPTPSTAPVRLAILDVNNDGRFDEGDLAVYRAAYFGVPEPAMPDYGRHDLNGDGFTGGSRRERFDLDRIGSTQFGAAAYGVLAGGYSESSLTDAEILCFYADSPMYEGTIDGRNQLLQDLCSVKVSVSPQSPSVAAGGSQQFAATVTGTSDPRVTWSATGGSITAAGLYTASAVAGTFAVRATSVVNPNSFADATVTVTAGIKSNVFIGIGGVNVPAGHIRASILTTGFDLTRPLSETSFVLSEFSRALSGVSIGIFSILVMEPVAFAYTTGNVAQLNLGGACGADLNVTAGNVRRDPASPGLFGNGEVGIVVCESDSSVHVGGAEFLNINGSRSSTINVSTGSISSSIFITNNSVSSIALTGVLPGLFMASNSDVALSLGHLFGNATIERNNFPQGLSSLGISSIGGNLTMRFNGGFTDAEAQDWAATRVSGSITLLGNFK